MSRKLELHFAHIDAREQSVVALEYDMRPATMHNALIEAQAKREYLEGILELQKKLKLKYDAQIDQSEDHGDNCDACNEAYDQVWGDGGMPEELSDLYNS